MKNRHYLLIYRALGRRISNIILIFALLSVGAYTINHYVYNYIPWSDTFLVPLAIFFLFAWALIFYRYQQAAVIIKKDHLLIQSPWRQEKVAYDHITGIIPTRLSDKFISGNIGATELNWLKGLYEKPSAMVQTKKVPSLSIHRLFISPAPDSGLILVVPDWVSFADTAEKARSHWQKKQQATRSKNATLTEEESNVVSVPSAQKTSAQAKNEKPLLLIITADENHKANVQRLLKPSYRLRFAESGVKGLRMARDQQPSLILSDIELPNMNGIQTLKAIRKSERIQNIPILLIGKDNSSETAVAALKNGGNDFITQPYHDGILIERIRLWLRESTELKTLKHINDALHNKTLNQMAELVRRGELINFLPHTVAQSVMSGEIDSRIQPLQRLNATVLFIDIVGFTTLTAQLDPQVLSEILNEYLREMTAAAIQFNGTVDKFIGDAVMVLYGAPDIQDEATQVWNATQTAFLMRQRVEEMSMIWRSRLPRDLEVRIGFNTGECTAGVFGNDLLKSYTVVGRAVNIAARLQSAAQPGQIVCSTETVRFAQGKVLSRPLGHLALKGVPHPVDACSLEKLMTPDQIRREAENRNP